MGVIYRIWNKRNGKSYIGQSINDADKRVRRHLTGKGSIQIAADLHKYNEADWNWEVLADESDYPDVSLNELERRFIRQYNSGMTGYNLTYGEKRKGEISFNLTKIEISDNQIREVLESLIKLGCFPGIDSIDVFMLMRQDALDDLEISDAIEEFSKAMEEKLDEIKKIIMDGWDSLDISDDILKRLEAEFPIEYDDYTKSFVCLSPLVTIKENS